jgi:predicted phosphodiesterase
VSLARIGVLGDVHTHADRVAAALETFREVGVERVICCGDIVDGPGDLDRCIELLEDADALTVAGNHERWALAGTMRDLPNATRVLSASTRRYLEELPRTARIDTARGGALVCHAVGEDDLFFLNPDTRGYSLQPVMPILRNLMLDPSIGYMIAAHSHNRMVRMFQGLVVINAGTLHDDGPPGFIIADFADGQVLPYDFDGDRPVAVEPLRLPDPPPLPG